MNTIDIEKLKTHNYYYKSPGTDKSSPEKNQGLIDRLKGCGFTDADFEFLDKREKYDNSTNKEMKELVELPRYGDYPGVESLYVQLGFRVKPLSGDEITYDFNDFVFINEKENNHQNNYIVSMQTEDAGDCKRLVIELYDKEFGVLGEIINTAINNGQKMSASTSEMFSFFSSKNEDELNDELQQDYTALKAVKSSLESTINDTFTATGDSDEAKANNLYANTNFKNALEDNFSILKAFTNESKKESAKSWIQIMKSCNFDNMDFDQKCAKLATYFPKTMLNDVASYTEATKALYNAVNDSAILEVLQGEENTIVPNLILRFGYSDTDSLTDNDKVWEYRKNIMQIEDYKGTGENKTRDYKSTGRWTDRKSTNASNALDQSLTLEDTLEARQQTVIRGFETPYFITDIKTKFSTSGIRYTISAISVETIMMNKFRMVQRYANLEGTPSEVLHTLMNVFNYSGNGTDSEPNGNIQLIWADKWDIQQEADLDNIDSTIAEAAKNLENEENKVKDPMKIVIQKEAEILAGNIAGNNEKTKTALNNVFSTSSSFHTKEILFFDGGTDKAKVLKFDYDREKFTLKETDKPNVTYGTIEFEAHTEVKKSKPVFKDEKFLSKLGEYKGLVEIETIDGNTSNMYCFPTHNIFFQNYEVGELDNNSSTQENQINKLVAKMKKYNDPNKNSEPYYQIRQFIKQMNKFLSDDNKQMREDKAAVYSLFDAKSGFQTIPNDVSTISRQNILDGNFGGIEALNKIGFSTYCKNLSDVKLFVNNIPQNSYFENYFYIEAIYDRDRSFTAKVYPILTKATVEELLLEDPSIRYIPLRRTIEGIFNSSSSYSRSGLNTQMSEKIKELIKSLDNCKERQDQLKNARSEAKQKLQDAINGSGCIKKISIPLGGEDAWKNGAYLSESGSSYTLKPEDDKGQIKTKSLASILNTFCSVCPPLKDYDIPKNNTSNTKSEITDANGDKVEITSRCNYIERRLTWKAKMAGDKLCIFLFYNKPYKPKVIRLYRWGVGDFQSVVKDVSINANNEYAFISAISRQKNANGEDTYEIFDPQAQVFKSASSLKGGSNSMTISDNDQSSSFTQAAYSSINYTGTLTVMGDPVWQFGERVLPYSYPIYIDIRLPTYGTGSLGAWQSGVEGTKAWYSSGYYVVTKITHTLNSSGYTTSLDVAKYPGIEKDIV